MIAKSREASLSQIHSDLQAVNKFVTATLGFTCTPPVADTESADYGAHTFKINELSVKYRAAKITPTKTGQFVTLWKRNGDGPIQPFDISDDIDLFIISTRHDMDFGLFIFPKSILHDKGIISGKREGKRAIRVYPPWNTDLNRQAQKSQHWQADYFLKIENDHSTDLARAKMLLTLKST